MDARDPRKEVWSRLRDYVLSCAPGRRSGKDVIIGRIGQATPERRYLGIATLRIKVRDAHAKHTTYNIKHQIKIKNQRPETKAVENESRDHDVRFNIKSNVICYT